MPSVLPYGFEKLSNGDLDVLRNKAKQQDIDRGVKKDQDYYQTHGINKAFNEIPKDVVIPCDNSKLDIQRAGEYVEDEEDLKSLNPIAYEAFIQRAKKIEKEQKQIEIAEYQQMFKEAKESIINPIMVLSADIPLFE